MTRTELRENTFKLLYCKEFHDVSEMPKQYELFWDELNDVNNSDKDFITERVDSVVENTEKIDEEINNVAVGWTTERMFKIDLIILRLAYYEMKMDDNVPEKVAVNEAVKLAKKYGSDESPAFINGILAKLF